MDLIIIMAKKNEWIDKKNDIFRFPSRLPYFLIIIDNSGTKNCNFPFLLCLITDDDNLITNLDRKIYRILKKSDKIRHYFVSNNCNVMCRVLYDSF